MLSDRIWSRIGCEEDGYLAVDSVGVAMGGQPETFNGLAGLGDLVLTCTGELSRNRDVGVRLARGAFPFSA